jgi:hypothetical protein
MERVAGGTAALLNHVVSPIARQPLFFLSTTIGKSKKQQE